MAWDTYTVVTSEYTLRVYKVRAQSRNHARDKFLYGDPECVDISPGDEEVVDVYLKEEDG